MLLTLGRGGRAVERLAFVHVQVRHRGDCYRCFSPAVISATRIAPLGRSTADSCEFAFQAARLAFLLTTKNRFVIREAYDFQLSVSLSSGRVLAKLSLSIIDFFAPKNRRGSIFSIEASMTKMLRRFGSARMLGTLAMGCAIGWAENASATLLDRGPNMVYDTTLDITWTRDANLSGQPKTWQDANAWAASLVLEGFDDWRLPSVSVSGLPYPLNAATFGSTFTYACAVNYLGSPEEIACRDDELAYMYWYNLLGAGLDQTGNQVSYLGLFHRHWQPAARWLFPGTG